MSSSRVLGVDRFANLFMFLCFVVFFVLLVFVLCIVCPVL